MIRTVLIEDELGSRNALKQILETYIKDIQIVGECETVKESVALLQEINADLVFMDINLPDGKSFDILDQLDQETLDFDIVFITAYPDIQVKALDYFFLQYLTKPYDIDKIEKVIQQHKKNQNKNNENYKSILKEILNQEAKLIPIPNITGIDFISTDDIIRLEAQRNYTMVYTQEGKKHLSSKNIKQFEKLLDNKLFFEYINHTSFI